MKAIHDPHGLLAGRITALNERFDLPETFPPAVLVEAENAAAIALGADTHRDRTGEAFVTLDPASATDLDQAFRVEMTGSDVLLHYAIADVAWFVRPGSALEEEAWARGMTIYLPGDKVRLYPPVLSEGAASLLPDGPRPAVIFAVRVDPAGTARLDGVERAIIRSRAKLAYEAIPEAALPPAAVELTQRIEAAERARGAARVDPPEQELEALAGGGYSLQFRPRRRSEEVNASLSMACNLSVARLFQDHRTGLFRVMEEPDAEAVTQLRQQAAALELAWPQDEDLQAFERRLDPQDWPQAAMMMAIRRAGNGAGYAAFDPAAPPWHAAIAAPYAHTTAPLRRLADRYVVEAALALANDRPLPDHVTQAFAALPPVMARAASLAGRVERAALDLAEAMILADRVGQRAAARIVAARPGRITVQLLDHPVIVNVNGMSGVPGKIVDLRLARIDTANGRIEAEPV
ncbi:ribonuclease catalytic domain-containing protein [Pelagerythrobacter aerophilus]